MTIDKHKRRISLLAPDIATRYHDADKYGILGIWLMVRGIATDLPDFMTFQKTARRRLGRELPTDGMVIYNLSLYLRPTHEGKRWTAEIVALEDPDLIGTPWDDVQHEIVALVKQRFRQWGYPRGDRL